MGASSPMCDLLVVRCSKISSAPFMASTLQKYLHSEYSHSVHGGVSSLLAVVSSPAHQHAPQECTAVPGPSLGTIPHTTGPSSTVHCRPPWQCREGGGSRVPEPRRWPPRAPAPLGRATTKHSPASIATKTAQYTASGDCNTVSLLTGEIQVIGGLRSGTRICSRIRIY